MFLIFFFNSLQIRIKLMRKKNNEEEKSMVCSFCYHGSILNICIINTARNSLTKLTTVLLPVLMWCLLCVSQCMLRKHEIHTAVAGVQWSVWGPVVSGTCSLRPTARPRWWRRPGSDAARSESPTADETRPPSGGTQLLLIMNLNTSMVTRKNDKRNKSKKTNEYKFYTVMWLFCLFCMLQAF